MSLSSTMLCCCIASITTLYPICQEMVMTIAPNEHVIKCSYCGRDLIVMDNVNDGVAFLSHLKLDHGIFYTFQKMTQTKVKKESSKQMLDSFKEHH